MSKESSGAPTALDTVLKQLNLFNSFLHKHTKGYNEAIGQPYAIVNINTNNKITDKLKGQQYRGQEWYINDRKTIFILNPNALQGVDSFVFAINTSISKLPEDQKVDVKNSLIEIYNEYAIPPSSINQAIENMKEVNKAGRGIYNVFEGAVEQTSPEVPKKVNIGNLPFQEINLILDTIKAFKNPNASNVLDATASGSDFISNIIDLFEKMKPVAKKLGILGALLSLASTVNKLRGGKSIDVSDIMNIISAIGSVLALTPAAPAGWALIGAAGAADVLLYIQKWLGPPKDHTYTYDEFYGVHGDLGSSMQEPQVKTQPLDEGIKAWVGVREQKTVVPVSKYHKQYPVNVNSQDPVMADFPYWSHYETKKNISDDASLIDTRQNNIGNNSIILDDWLRGKLEEINNDCA